MADQIPDSTKLLPCPFCGKEDAFVERSDLSACHVVCNECGARGPACCDETEADAAASESDAAEPGELAARRAWNTRAAMPAMDREAVERLRETVMEDEQLDGVRLSHSDALSILSTLSADAIRQGEGWQPIETAPRDGTWFIADGGGLDRPTPMKWCERVGAWEADAVMLEDWDQQAEGYSRPLFWIAIPDRLPATPASHASDGGEA